MKASIVVVNHNYARFLQQAIDSALAQSYSNTEVVVVDDGSTDRSSEVIESYRERIKAVFENCAGQSSCYSRGLAASTGDLLLYLDADDFLHPDCLSEVIGHWTKGCVKAHYYLAVVDESGSAMHAVVPTGRLRGGFDPLKMMRIFGAYCSPPASGNVYSRDFLANILPMQNESELWTGGADSVTIFAAPFFGTIVAIPKVLGFYRRHANASGGVTSTFNAKTSLQRLEKEHEKDLLRDRSWQLAIRRTQTPKLLEPSRLKRRMCYLRLSGRGLEPADNRVMLFFKGVLSSIWWSGYSAPQKFIMSWWFLGMALLPLKTARFLIRPALAISDRPSPVRKFFQAIETEI
jgi:glycosyltransferase involved in cell wall biosynthesis